VITKPNITLEPKEKGGEVTFQQSENPCVVVDVGDGNSCTINNIRMILRGPNRDMNRTTFSVDMQFERKANEKCMQEFFTHKPEEMYCIILVRSGHLILNGCTLSVDGIYKDTYRKVPCVVALPESSIELNKSNFKGDTMNEADTSGVLSINAETVIKNCNFAHFLCGAIMIQALPQNKTYIAENQILSCSTAGIYI
jgi:hypothetical protein